MDFLPWNGDARRQYINARATFLAARIAASEARDLIGRMFWRCQSGHEYLIRVSKRGAQTSLGRRSPETEAIYTNFNAKKSIVKERLDGLDRKLTTQARLNQVFALDRADAMLIEVLNSIEKTGLGKSLLVVDSNALIGYETTAGVHGDGRKSARDNNVTSGQGKRLILGAIGTFERSRLARALQAVDKSFSSKASRLLWSAVNRTGFEVRVVGVQNADKKNRPSDPNIEFWNCDCNDLGWLLRAPTVQTVIVGKRGMMATMLTADPRAFVLHNFWMGTQMELPDDVKESALHQALLAFRLVEDYLPNFSFNDVGAEKYGPLVRHQYASITRE